MLESAGAPILTCHGRIREQRGRNTNLADWSKNRAVKDSYLFPYLRMETFRFGRMFTSVWKKQVRMR
ncbi:hypothetical protein F5141DRAFT_2554 [Pisolithus sp. B1]|nr:hypothetical protein F5141DRAFT_2554 [Pisolithus sp. B1]